MSPETRIADVRILVVDDKADVLQEARAWLQEEFGYRYLETVDTIKEAREKLNQPYDVIIADMRMPEDQEGGFTILEEVKKGNITSIVIILTANDTAADCRKAFKMGAWDYIPKNMTGVVIFEVVHNSIQEALSTFSRSGNARDREWIISNMGYLLDNYDGRFIAVLNNTIIADAPKREDLDDIIREQNLPRFLTTIEKIDNNLFKQLTPHLLVFVEGPTDVKYIKTALAVLGRQDILDAIVLDTVGNRFGNKGGGESNLKNGFLFLLENRLIKNKVLFLFDPDVKDLPNHGKDVENLYIRRMDEYSSDKTGIESLFLNHVLEEGFSKGYVCKILRQYPPNLTYKVENKKSFCKWICRKRENIPEDFSGFQKIVRLIDSLLSTE